MGKIVSAIGGSGSTYLVQRLKELGYTVGHKPDTVFRPNHPETRVPGGFTQDEGTFVGRSGFDPIGSEIDQVLPEYLAYVGAHEGHVAVLNTAAELGLLSRFEVRDVLFLVRHPLHTYASWCHESRHLDIAEHFGGINAKRAIEYMARRWVRHTSEYIRLRSNHLAPRLIRFESATEDASTDFERQLVAGLDGSSRHHGFLNPEAEHYLRRISLVNYSAIYGDTW